MRYPLRLNVVSYQLIDGEFEYKLKDIHGLTIKVLEVDLALDTSMKKINSLPFSLKTAIEQMKIELELN